MVALTIACYSENFTPINISVAEVQNRSVFLAFAVRCCNCMSTMFGVSLFDKMGFDL